jgi:hypothetical protein
MECKSALQELSAQLSRASSSARERELEKERATQDAERARSLAREGEARSAQLAQEKAKFWNSNVGMQALRQHRFQRIQASRAYDTRFTGIHAHGILEAK